MTFSFSSLNFYPTFYIALWTYYTTFLWGDPLISITLPSSSLWSHFSRFSCPWVYDLALVFKPNKFYPILFHYLFYYLRIYTPILYYFLVFPPSCCVRRAWRGSPSSPCLSAKDLHAPESPYLNTPDPALPHHATHFWRHL